MRILVHNSQIKEAWAKRRRYLCQSVTLNASSCLVPILVAVCGISLCSFAITWTTQKSELYWLFAILCVAFPFLLVYFLMIGASWMKYAQSKATSLPYVPTVDKQIANLAAEDVLLRGSNQPVAVLTDLLLPARDGRVSDSDDGLLRPAE